MSFHDAPHHHIIHGIVAMDNAISKVHDAAQFRNTSSDLWVETVNAIQGLADNFELTLHRASEKTVGKVFSKAMPGSVLKNALACLADVKQQLLRRDGHKAGGAQQKRFRGSMD